MYYDAKKFDAQFNQHPVTIYNRRYSSRVLVPSAHVHVKVHGARADTMPTQWGSTEILIYEPGHRYAFSVLHAVPKQTNKMFKTVSTF